MARMITNSHEDIRRLRSVGILWLLLTALFIVRLFYLQTVAHAKYEQEATGTRNLNAVIKAKRGEIYGTDARKGQDVVYPIALNRDQFLLVSDNRKVVDADAEARLLGAAGQMSPEEIDALKQKLSDSKRAYQVLIKDVQPGVIDALKNAIDENKLKGLYFDRSPARFYPERELLGHITGFVARDDHDEPVGRYGAEGFFEDRLNGVNGYVKTEKDPFGGWIPVADRDFAEATDGDDAILTIDRTIQLKLCDALAKGVKEYQARRGSGIIMDPKTGAIYAMCNVPNFDPNQFSKVDDASVYNNDAIFRSFEPGSVFKAFTMAAALDAHVVNPDTTYVDEGFVRRDNFTIRNAANKTWGRQTMTDVIKESINTGTVFAADLLGLDKFRGYMEQFGFGQKTGIDLKTEEKGNIKSLSKSGSVYLATASFGQGITVTPIQLITGYAALANGGVLVPPHVLAAWRSPRGEIMPYKAPDGKRIVSEKAAAQITEMMRKVVEEAHGKLAAVPGYTLAGKTGTAQIVGSNGKYEDESINNHTFIGYGPVKDPRFVMLVTYEAPHARFAESTAVPTFGEVARFLLEYLGVPHDKPDQM